MTLEDSLRTLSLDYLNLLINGQAFSDVTFSVEGRFVHAHRCILAARSLFFRKYFCGPDPPSGLDPSGSRINPWGYEVFLLLLQFLYSGQVSIVPPKHEPRPNCGERGCWHTHCTSAVDLALDTLAAARYFGVEQLAMLTQKQLASMVVKASIEDVMKVLIASRTQDNQLWTTCSHLIINASPSPRSFYSSDVELVKLMVMGEGLNLDEALALHYAVENCSREVVKALLELGAADVNYPAGPAGKTPLHIAAEMVSPDMVSVLLDHHADPNVRTVDGGAVPGLVHIEPNKLRLCLELVQSAALVLSREEGSVNATTSNPIYPPRSDEHNTSSSGTNLVSLNLDSRLVYLNLGAAGSGQMGSRMEGDNDSSQSSQRDHHAMSRHVPTMYHHHSHDY
ncbi:ankyrin repeat family protein [Salix suchowensis]|nr:ankyrin repeat family protein [Salix suchowensis]